MKSGCSVSKLHLSNAPAAMNAAKEGGECFRAATDHRITKYFQRDRRPEGGNSRKNSLLLNERGNKTDTVGCARTRWDGLSLQDSRGTPAVVPGARRRARICRVSRWIFGERSGRTRITRYAAAVRPPNRCYNVHTMYTGRHSIWLNSALNSREGRQRSRGDDEEV